MSDDRLEAWQRRLAAAEADLREREHRALQGDPTQEELRAFAAERDKIASEQDALADARDERATERDVVALRRDVRASRRDEAARAYDRDASYAAVDRFVAGTDRDLAAGDRADAVDDRRRGVDARRAAAENRERAAADRDTGASRQDESDREVAGLREALRTRLTIGQAEGLLMARYRIDADAAFRLLTKLSQERHIKLRDVAARLVDDAARWAQRRENAT